VNQEIPACGFRDLYQSAGKNQVEKLGLVSMVAKRNLGIAEEGEFGQTTSLKRLNTAKN